MSARLDPQSRPCIAPGHRLQWEEAQGAYVLLFPEGMVKLNESAGRILERCDGTRSVADIVVELRGQFPGADLERDVLEFLAVACERDWVRA